MGLTYALSEIWDNKTDYDWWRGRFIDHVVARYFTTVGNHDARPVVERDWDTLVILDACRYDLFEEVATDRDLPGVLERRQSVHSGTPGFLEWTFGADEFRDIVYVTSNPYVDTELEREQFHDVVHVWRDGWDDELETVTPEVMLEHTLDAIAAYPNKRIVSHFMQPHAPFIGDYRLDKIRNETVVRQRALGEETTPSEERLPGPFDRLRLGEVTKEELWRAYRSNIERAMPAVEELLTEVDGKTAVTADHGNALGEFAWPFPIRIYGHPLGVFIPALVDVPWLTSTTGDRREVEAEPPARDRDQVDADIQERLQMLGYAE
jgi:hypothetical protein